MTSRLTRASQRNPSCDVAGDHPSVAAPREARSLITATVDFDREGIQWGHLRVPHSSDRSAYGHIPIPVSVAKRGDGPTVLLIGGVHGDEHEGPVALMRFVRGLALDRIEGRIIAIPALNFPAYLSGTRTSPIDALNLNRCFPGDRNGSPTQMIAHYVETELLPISDYCFDFHAGGASLNYLPTLIIDASESKDRLAALEQLISRFRPPRLLYMDMLGEDRVIAAAAKRHNVLFVTGEFGGGGTVSRDGLEVLISGLGDALSGLGILERSSEGLPRGEPVTTRKLRVKGAAHYLFAHRAGIFEPCFRLGDRIRTGQLAGYLHDPLAPFQAPEEARFEGEGLVMCIRTHALVAAGDCLGHLASDDV